jgi:hypothetical protein
MARRVAVVGLVGVYVLVASACGSSSSNPAPGGAGDEAGGSDAVEQGGRAGGSAGASITPGNGGMVGGGAAGTSAGGAQDSAGSAGTVADAGNGGAMMDGGGAGGMDGASGGEGGMPPFVDTTPPGPVSLPASGTFNMATGFDCAAVSNIEAGASVYYELSTDGSPPGEPTVAGSTKLGQNQEICGIDPDGVTKIRVRQVDAAGNLGAVSDYQYVVDSTPPVICAAVSIPGPRAYRDLPLHLRLTAEAFGTASVDIAGLGTFELTDDGKNGDKFGNDGVYETDYTVPAGADLPSALLTGHFEDAAGNPATDFVGDKLYIDRTSTPVSGAIVEDAIWTAAASPYVITGDTAFDAGTSLIIEPGAVVIFKPKASLAVLGGFSAVGTVDAPIAMYGAKLSLYGIVDTLTYDEATEDYVTGPRFDYVQMRDGELTLGKEDPFGSAGAYITNSAIGAITGEYFFRYTHGMYIRHSWVGQIANQSILVNARLRDSYFDSVTIEGYSSFEALLSYNQIGKLTVSRWQPTFTLEHCNVGQMVLLNPTLSAEMAFHDNNLGSPLTADTLWVEEGAAANPVVDATGNYWGTTTTAQMTSLGTKANISAIHDFYDNVKLTKVDYKNWLTAPTTAGPNWPRSELVAEAATCEPGTGGTGGTGGGGNAGTGGGGAGGNAGTGGSGAGGNGSGSLLGGCNSPTGYFCTEYSGSAQDEAALPSNCQLTQQTWQDTCPSANVIGVCTAPDGQHPGVTMVTRYYTSAPGDLQQLKEACEVGLQGTWTTP